MTRGAPGARLTPAQALRALEQIRGAFGPGLEPRKLALLGRLLRGRLRTAREVERYHEALVFLHAYPDSLRIEAQVRVNLAAFSRRSDLRQHREALASSGIEGTPIDYRFFYPMARWLATRWPRQLYVDWPEFENASRLEPLLGLLALPAEQPGLDELELPVRGWIERLKRADENDGAFLARRFAQLPMRDHAREALYDSLDPPMRLEPGPGTPSRTRARTELVFATAGAEAARRARAARGAGKRGGLSAPGAGGTHYITAPLDRGRPVLERELRRPPLGVRALSVREGVELVELARAAMVTRQRDLDAFAYADPRDVRLVDMGEGLQFACLGVVPERRLLLESVYGFVTLKNGVPIGYVLVSALFNSSEVAYNVFDTYRGAEAGRIYGRVLAMTAHLLGSDTFTIYPYQLGDHNDEALESGAWWFYWKLGFRTKDREVLRLARSEQERMKRNPRHRSSIATLRRLARRNLFFHARAVRDDVIGVLPLGNVGLAAMRLLARRFGFDREQGARTCAREARALLGASGVARWTPDERRAWDAWAPLVLALPGIERWRGAERRALVAVIRAKGGVREDEFVRRFDAHRKLRAAVRRLALISGLHSPEPTSLRSR